MKPLASARTTAISLLITHRPTLFFARVLLSDQTFGSLFLDQRNHSLDNLLIGIPSLEMPH